MKKKKEREGGERKKKRIERICCGLWIVTMIQSKIGMKKEGKRPRQFASLLLLLSP